MENVQSEVKRLNWENNHELVNSLSEHRSLLPDQGGTIPGKYKLPQWMVKTSYKPNAKKLSPASIA